MNVKKIRMGRLLLALVLVCLPTCILASTADEEAVLLRGESFFKQLKERQYTALWQCLSKRSRETIIRDTLRNLGADGQEGVPNKGEIEKDFVEGGKVSKAYWSGFLAVFNPDVVLEESRWSIDAIKKENAVIVLQYRKAEAPVHLRMVKEDGEWRIGLVETFWGK